MARVGHIGFRRTFMAIFSLLSASLKRVKIGSLSVEFSHRVLIKPLMMINVFPYYYYYV